ncbi:uncharacterized protein E0L32_008338 [Thyridium curvatum]|uniref:Uncharacterized protein n=1 Tax=Thyridium curvatum TaxID=1093900 RepID=A0A507B0G5_9PEZI|nr:uncharacterized protein E0L32_008338 [Thyridium curvatum]TPX10769.1 hypothetical protein E0L32_008338 [Thyridium curvatum]
MSLAGSVPLQSGQAVQPNPMPSLGAPFNPVPSDDSTPRAGSDVGQDADDVGEVGEKKQKKRGLFGFGKKKATNDDSSAKALNKDKPDLPPPEPSEKERPTRRTTASPIQTEHTYMTPASPTRGAMASSPRLASPAGSQIFERDVQESAVLMPNSPAIPSHISTENHIPPVLDASSEAITDNHLDPDSVEIITHTAHQPAAVTVSEALTHDSSSNVGAASWTDELAAFSADKEDSASNYGSFDTNDVRRLSFISFADVVQAEQVSSHTGASASRDSMHLAGLTSLASAGANRSPSPIRSPVSSQGGPGTSPPTSKSGSIKGLEMSPVRKPLGSPTASATTPHMTAGGEISIETMSQALRRTGSRDLSAVRSLPTSPIEGPSSR